MKSSDKNKSRPNDSIGIGVAGSTATMHVTSMSGKKSPIPKKNIPVTDAKQQRRSFDNPIEGLITQQKKFFTSEINGDATSPSKQKNKLSRDPPMSTQGIELDNVELVSTFKVCKNPITPLCLYCASILNFYPYFHNYDSWSSITIHKVLNRILWGR